MSRMAGVVLMLIGVIFFAVGLISYISPKKSSPNVIAKTTKHNIQDSVRVLPSTSVADSVTPVASTKILNKPISKTPDTNDLETVINMAIVDGVLTPNERNLIRKLAVEKGLDYSTLIKDVENRISTSGVAETQVIDYNEKNGYDFEKFIVLKFDKKYFKIKEWTGDKYVKGVYSPTTLHPDLLIELELKKKSQSAEFSVECKWRRNYYKNGIEIATDEQINRYKKFEKSRGIPVFIAVGIGGNGENPKELFIIPLKDIESNFIPFVELQKYRKIVESDFYFKIDLQELS